jgi:multiple sugar transport system ATP-binding protein
MARVVLEQLTKTFQSRNGTGVCAIDQMGLVVEDQELLVIVGPSGCGKTTLLRLISGLEKPTSGTIAMDGLVLNPIAARDRNVAMVFQNPALYPHMSAYENMAFGLRLRKHSREDIDRRVNEAADLLGLTDCLTRKPMELSGGECQRVALGRAIVRRPKLFLFDEPLSNLDPQLRLQMRREIANLHKRLKATLIYVTHDQSEAMTLGHRVAVLDHGRLHQVGKPLEVYQRPADRFVAGFIGSPPMNFLQGTIVQQEEAVYFQMRGSLAPDTAESPMLCLEEKMPETLKNHLGRVVILGIRPEHIAHQSGKPDSKSRRSVCAVAQCIDRLGPESYLHLATPGGDEFTARVASDLPITAGGSCTLEFQMSHAHFFDANSGNRLRDG